MKTFIQLGNAQAIQLKGFTSTKALVLLGWLLSLSLLTCAQELKIGDTHKEKVKGAIVYSKYVTNAELTFPSKNITSIKMNTGAGFLEVVPSETDEIALEAQVVNAALSRKDAEKFIDKPDQYKFERMIRNAGFSYVSHKNFTNGIVAMHTGFKL